MPETTPAGAMPAAADATSAQSTTTGAAGTPPAMGATPSPTDDPLGDAGKRALDAERSTARDAVKRADAAEKALKALQDAQLSESEKKDKRLVELEGKQAEWESERQGLVLRSAVTTEAGKLGFIDPTDAIGLIDRSAVEFAKDGTPQNVDILLTALAKAKPHLIGRGRPFGSADAGVGGTSGAPIFQASQLNDRTFYVAHQAEIMEAMRQGRIVDDNPK
jgi:hypothetical protein